MGRLIITDGMYALDGGSITLDVRDAAGATHAIELAQRLFLDSAPPASIPGRLYFDAALVPIRSELERRIIAALGDATIAAPPPQTDNLPAGPRLILGDDIAAIQQAPWEDNLARWQREIIAFVQSDEYVRLAATIPRADADPPDGR
ncbi:MAG TPA: hypothetical protein VGE07_30580 [Herpetosiphonaceae bacterium]